MNFLPVRPKKHVKVRFVYFDHIHVMDRSNILRMEDAYEMFSDHNDGSNHQTFRVERPINESKFPKNIVLYFTGTAHVRVLVNETLIEEGLSDDGYVVSNFKDIAFPYELFPKLSFEVDVPYTVTFHEEAVSMMSRHVLQHCPISHELAPNSLQEFMILDDGHVSFTHRNPQSDQSDEEFCFDALAVIDVETVAVECVDFEIIVESAAYSYLKNRLMFSYGRVNNCRIFEKNGEYPVPCVLVKEAEAKDFIRALRDDYPVSEFKLSDTKPSKLIKRHMKYIEYIMQSALQKKTKAKEKTRERLTEVNRRHSEGSISDRTGACTPLMWI